MQTAKQMNTRLILQGEVGIYHGLNSMEITLKTPVPTSCTIVTLFGKEKKIAVMAHVDDYVSIKHLFYFINEQMQKEYQCSLKSIDFEAKVFGGSEDSFSKGQQEKIIQILKTFEKVKWEKLECESKERPQVVMSATTGKVSFLFDKHKNFCVEYLQTREYYFFNKFFLDKEYKGWKGEDIPYFEVGLAMRSEFSLPKFEMNDMTQNSINAALHLEDTNEISLPIVFYKRKPIANEESSLQILTHMIKEFKDPSLEKSFQEKDFTLMLRQSCSEIKCIKITQHLFDCRFAFNIDLFAKGTKSGTALDVAKKYKNEKAIKLLEPFFKK